MLSVMRREEEEDEEGGRGGGRPTGLMETLGSGEGAPGGIGPEGAPGGMKRSMKRNETPHKTSTTYAC